MSITERYCTNSYRYYCFSWSTRTVRRGLEPVISSVLALYDAGEESVRATVPEVGESYRVNVTNADTKKRVLTELAFVIDSFPTAERADAVRVWATLRAEEEGLRNLAIASAKQASQDAFAESLRIEAMEREERAEARHQALAGTGAALGAIFAIGMVLAVLAIERNTRALHHVVRTQMPILAGESVVSE